MRRIRAGLIEWICLLALGGCVHDPGGDATALEAKRRAEIQALLAQPSASNLATAALLSYMPGDAPAPLDLLERAERLAPQRPEFVWLQAGICRRLHCDAAAAIDSRLQALDPGNGFVWLPDLERAEQAAAEPAVTAAILRIGAAERMTFYETALQSMVFDGMTVANPRDRLAARAFAALGLVAGESIPPLQPLTKACRNDQFGIPGRREACRTLTTRMERADTVLGQSLALSMQERWEPLDDAQREALRAKRRQLDYEMQMAGQMRWRTDRDMAIRLNADRNSQREEDVMLAVMQAYRIPPTPPPEWQDARRAQ